MVKRKTCECGCGEIPHISKITRAKYGWVKGQQVRFMRGHYARWAYQKKYRVEESGYETPCWVWLHCRDKDGYGIATWKGRKMPAHRMMFLASGREIALGLVLDHLCMNQSCVNPEHLEAVTSGDNTRRYWDWRRQNATT